MGIPLSCPPLIITAGPGSDMYPRSCRLAYHRPGLIPGISLLFGVGIFLQGLSVLIT